MRLEQRVNLALLVEWVLQARRDQQACREREAGPGRLDLWENVVPPAMLANLVLWVHWVSLVF